MTAIIEAKRRHAYELLQRDANLSLADCQFYEDEVRRWITEEHAFTAYEISYAVNSELIRAGKVWLRHNLTRDAVHALISMYAVAAGYESQLVYLGPGRMPRLYYPNDAARQQWEAAHKPATLRAVAKALEKITRLETLLTTPEPQRSPAGKPGRKALPRHRHLRQRAPAENDVERNLLSLET